MTTACFLINRCPSTALNKKTPEEVWSGHPPTYDRLRVFGCVALKCMFIGYAEGVKGYKLWCLEYGHNKCIISRDVVFNESEMAYKTASHTNKVHSDLTPKKAMLEVEPTDTAESKQEHTT